MLWSRDAHNNAMQTPEPFERAEPPRPVVAREVAPLPQSGRRTWAFGQQLALLGGFALMLSAFMGWYSGREADGLTLAVIGWHTGALGKLVFFIGLAVLALVALSEAGIELPAQLPQSLLVVGLGALATVFVLISLVSIPEAYFGRGRGIGIWIGLVSAVAVVVSGLLLAAEDL